MELKDAIYNRRTVRQFKDDEVSDEVLHSIQEAGTWAPSHGNNQPWEFINIGEKTRKQLALIQQSILEAGPLQNPAIPDERKQGMRAFAQNFGNAPVLLAVAHAPALTPLDQYDFPMSSAACIQNILLSAWSQGVAGVWLSFGISPKVSELLGIADGGRVAGVLALGYPKMVLPAQPRLGVHAKLRQLP